MISKSIIGYEDKSSSVSVSKIQDNLGSNHKICFQTQNIDEKEDQSLSRNNKKILFNYNDHSELEQTKYKKQDSIHYDKDFYISQKSFKDQQFNFPEKQYSEIVNFKDATFSNDKNFLDQKTLIPNASNDVSIEPSEQKPFDNEKTVRRQRQQKQLEFIQILRNNIGFSNDIWRKRGFGVLQKLIFFSQRLMSVSITKKFRKIQKRQVDIINDRSAFYDIYRFEDYFDKDKPSLTQRIYFKYQSWVFKKKNNIIQKLEQTCLGKQIISLFKFIELEDLVIRPNSSFKIGWDILIMLLVIFNIFYLPIKIAFGVQYDQNKPYQQFMLGEGAKSLFVIDVFMNFNTSFFKQGVINNNRIDIIKRYGKSKFWFDIIIVLPYIFGENSQFYQSIFIFRAFLIRNIVHRLEEVFHPRNLGAALIDIIKVIFVISFIAHLFCCSFYYLSTFETNQITWVSKLNLDSNDVFGLYVAGVYYSVITMITLGYGDIVPITTVERIFVVGMTLVSCAVFAYSVNTISGIIGDFSSRKKYFRQKMMNLNLHIQKRGLNKQLAMTVRKYIEYLYKEEMVSNESAEKDLEQIPISLKEDVYQDIYGKLLRQNKVFNLNFSLEFLDKLALKMKEKRFGPEEIIYREGDEGNTLYFLIKGNVQLFLPIKGHKDNSYLQIQQLDKGTTFGFYSFFSGNNRETSARSMRVTSLVTLNLDDFREAAEKFPKDYEKFCMLRDQIKYSNLTKGLDVRCTSCDNYTHQLQQCPFLKYKPEKTILIAKYNKSDPMQRKEQQRRIIRSPNSLFLLQFITKEDIYCFLNLDNSDSDNDHYHQEQEEAVDLEEQFNDKRTSFANVEYKDDQSKFNDNTSQNYKDNYIKENSSVKELNNNVKDQAYIESQQNKRQSTYHRIESSLSYKRKIMSQHTNTSNIAKQASRIASRLSFRSQKIIIEKTQNQVIMDFIVIDIDKLKSYQNYLPQNNFEKVIHQYNESLIMQKVYKPKKQLYQIINKDRQKINLSKLRVIAAFKKVNKNQQIITTKHKIESQSRKKAILEQLKQHSEGNSDYLTYESNPNNGNLINNDTCVQRQSPEEGKYEIKVLTHSKHSINSERQSQSGQENQNNSDQKQVNLAIKQSSKSDNAIEQDILSKSTEDVDKIKFKILKKKKTSSFVVKPSQFFQENQIEEQEYSKDEIEQKRQKSHKQIHEAIMNYNMKRRSFSNIINNPSFTDIQQNEKDNN
ncbi:hypothetical protein ABPG74_014241 [Tetrahymena malaccensis]